MTYYSLVIHKSVVDGEDTANIHLARTTLNKFLPPATEAKTLCSISDYKRKSTITNRKTSSNIGWYIDKIEEYNNCGYLSKENMRVFVARMQNDGYEICGNCVRELY